MKAGRLVWGAIALGCFAAAFPAAGCSDSKTFPPRTRVGTVPKAFSARAVVSPADAAAYAESYNGALGIEGVRIERVLTFGDAYWVYLAEVGTGRGAFSLGVSPAGDLAARQFPAPDPELMWNQKYGHRARHRLSAIQENLSLEETESLLRLTLPGSEGIRPGEPTAYYGYALYPLCDDGHQVGEAAVNTADGKAVWDRFPERPASVWVAPGAREDLCR